jgi:hypothetical protein
MPGTRRVNSGRGHSYLLDGQKVDGVTTVIGNGIPKPALINWAAGTIASYVGERLDVDTTTGHVTADGITNVCLSEASLCRHIGTRTGHDAWKVEIPKGTTVFISGVTCGVTRGVNQYKAARAECDDCACARRMAESRGAGA